MNTNTHTHMNTYTYTHTHIHSFTHIYKLKSERIARETLIARIRKRNEERWGAGVEYHFQEI